MVQTIMKITLSKHAGFCDGVDRAYTIVEKIARDPRTRRPIFVLGSLVHNQDVVDKIEALGVGKISSDVEELKRFLREKENKIGTLIITAHGMGPKIYKLMDGKKIDLVDTTCPRVTKVQRLAKVFFDRNCQIVLIGDKEHKEVKGILEWAKKKATCVENEEELKKIKLNPNKKVAVISQTTQNRKFIRHAVAFIRKIHSSVEVVDTLCLSTHNRQAEVEKLARENDVVVIVGSKESANSTRLWEISHAINSRSYFIERAGELKKKGFLGCKKVGVTAGASTPGWIIEEVMQKLKCF